MNSSTNETVKAVAETTEGPETTVPAVSPKPATDKASAKKTNGEAKTCIYAGCDKPQMFNSNFCSTEHMNAYEATAKIVSAAIVTPKLARFEERLAAFGPQNLAKFMARVFPAQTALIEDVLYRRDQISLTGRRRHGKTTALLNISLAGALWLEEYLGFSIPQPFTTVAYFLEDDAAGLQKKLSKMLQGRELTAEQHQRLHIYTRTDLRKLKIKIKAGDKDFQKFIELTGKAAKPDFIVLDNLGMLVRGAYNDSEEIHELMELVFELAEGFNAAVAVAAHPRKQNGKEDAPVKLIDDPDAFFESCMGSSHFINTTGSMWGIEKDATTGYTYLSLGSKRVTGHDALTSVELTDNDWFKCVDDFGLAAKAVNNTLKRSQAWDLLPVTPFSFTEAMNAVRPALPYKNSFSPWWSELRRNKLIVPTTEINDNRYVKASGAVQAVAAQKSIQNAGTTSKPKATAAKPTTKSTTAASTQGKATAKLATSDPLDGILPGIATVDLQKIAKDRVLKARVQ